MRFHLERSEQWPGGEPRRVSGVAGMLFPDERSGLIDMLFLYTLTFVLKICTLSCVYVIVQSNLLRSSDFAENLI